VRQPAAPCKLNARTHHSVERLLPLLLEHWDCSGKSSIVSALCLGLGGKPSDMERGNKLEDFIQKGKTEAIIKVRCLRPAPTAAELPVPAVPWVAAADHHRGRH